MKLHKQIKHQGYNINIYYDPDPQSPRDWDNLGTLYTAHRRYCPEQELYEHFEDEEIFQSRGEFTETFLQNYIALPVYMYDHSGQTVSTTPFSCSWDSGLFGIIAVDIEKVKKEYGWIEITPEHRHQIEHYLQGEIETYDDYLQGNVYGYEIEREDDLGIVLDSCWGYFGDKSLDDMQSDAKGQIHYLLRQYKKQVFKRIKQKFHNLLSEIGDMFKYFPELIYPKRYETK